MEQRGPVFILNGKLQGEAPPWLTLALVAGLITLCFRSSPQE